MSAQAPRPAPRPGAPTGIACGFAGIAACLVLVLGTTGAGWLLVLLALVAGLLVAGFVMPAFALHGCTVTLDVPPDAVAGRPLTLGVSVTTKAPVELRVPALGLGWTGAGSSGTATVETILARRGVIDGYTVHVRGGAPLGLWWWQRRSDVVLDTPLHVAPQPAAVKAPWRHGPGATDASPVSGRRGDDLVRGVRDYVRGDPPKLVHWHASARTGSLVVRELEEPDTRTMRVTCFLAGPPPTVEVEASVAAGLVATALGDGCHVELVTVEATGVVTAATTTTVEAGRRLARAVPGDPRRLPIGSPDPRTATVDAAAFVQPMQAPPP